MGYYFRKVVMVALLVVAYSGAAWADNLTVTVTRTGAGVADAPKSGQASLQQALSGYDLGDVEAVEVSAGRFEAADWNWLNDKRYELNGLKRFVVTDGVESVADMPDNDWEDTSWGNQLEELRVAKLRKVGRKAFYGCQKIVSVSLPAVKEIGGGAFAGCLVLANALLPVAEAIRENAFARCGNLTDVSLPAVSEIDSGAFYNCFGLQTLRIGATPPSVGNYAFAGCQLLRKLELVDPDGTLLAGSQLAEAQERYRAAADGDTEDNLWYVWAFGATPAGNLSGTIDGVPFSNATSLESAFTGKDPMVVKELKVTGGTFQVADWAYLQEKSWEGMALETFIVESSVDRVADIPDLADRSQRYFPHAQTVRIAKVRRVGAHACMRCEELTDVSLPSASNISMGAFAFCVKLSSVSLPAVEKMGFAAFYGGETLRALQLGGTPPSSVSEYTFLGCSLRRNLELVSPDGTPLAGSQLVEARKRYRAAADGDKEDNLWYGWAFEAAPAGNLSGTIDGVPFSNAASLEAAFAGKDLAGVRELKVTGGTFQVADWAYLHEKGLDGLALETFIVESSVDRVADMPNLAEEDARFFPHARTVRVAKMRRVGKNTFLRCRDLESVSLPAVTEIGENAFSSCYGLTSVSLPEARVVGACAFLSCGLTNVSLPLATEIGESAFHECLRLLSVSLPAATKIGESAFEECRGLLSVSLPAAEVIGRNAFHTCAMLASASLPSAREIGESAFYDNRNLKTLQLGVTPPSVGSAVFNLCPDDRALIIVGADGVPLAGVAQTSAADLYDRNEGAANDGKWYGWGIEANPPTMLTVRVEPFGSGNVEVKRGGNVLTNGVLLVQADVLAVVGTPRAGYKLKTISANGASSRGGNEWEVTANAGEQVVFTVEFEALGATLGATITKPTDGGTLAIIRKEGGIKVNLGEVLIKGTVLVVTAVSKAGCEHKGTTAAGAISKGGNEWEVTANAGEQVVFTVEFVEPGAILGTTVIRPADGGTVAITRKAGGAVVSPGETLAKGDVLVVNATHSAGYKFKKVTATGVISKGGNEWEVTANAGEQVVFTVEFEKGQEGGGSNSSGKPTPVERTPLAQVHLFPNPSSGQLTVDAGAAVARCEVYSITGALLQVLEPSTSVFSIDLSASPSGVYVVRLVDMHGAVAMLRVVKR